MSEVNNPQTWSQKVESGLGVFFSSFLVLALFALVGGCGGSASGGTPLTPQQLYEQGLAAQRSKSAIKADEIAGQMLYFRDSRTQLCFAYFWENRHRQASYDQGGPALAQVPCGSVPAEMLVTTTVQPPR